MSRDGLSLDQSYVQIPRLRMLPHNVSAPSDRTAANKASCTHLPMPFGRLLLLLLSSFYLCKLFLADVENVNLIETAGSPVAAASQDESFSSAES